MSYARISVTLPESLLVATDRRARDLDRPRSWVVAEALRTYLGDAEASPPQRAVPSRVREPSVSYGAPLRPGIGPSRLAQLEADLALTPEERVLDAERTARAVPDRPRPSVSRLLVFDRYEDYLDWKRREEFTL
jgi:hypothetical protein